MTKWMKANEACFHYHNVRHENTFACEMHPVCVPEPEETTVTFGPIQITFDDIQPGDTVEKRRTRSTDPTWLTTIRMTVAETGREYVSSADKASFLYRDDVSTETWWLINRPAPPSAFDQLPEGTVITAGEPSHGLLYYKLGDKLVRISVLSNGVARGEVIANYDANELVSQALNPGDRFYSILGR